MVKDTKLDIDEKKEGWSDRGGWFRSDTHSVFTFVHLFMSLFAYNRESTI